MEQHITVFIRKWFGISVALYGRGKKVQLPLKALTEEFKVTEAKVHMVLRDSKDQVIRDMFPAIKTGRKQSASTAVAKAESKPETEGHCGETQLDRCDIGHSQVQLWSSQVQRKEESW